MFPDNDVLGNLGTSFIETSDKSFITELDTIKDPIVMGSFLDSNCYKFIESSDGFINWDKVIDLSIEGRAIVEDETIPIDVKLDTKKYLKFISLEGTSTLQCIESIS